MNSSSSILPCTFNYPDLSEVTRYVFGSAFILCGIMAAVGNTISLIILRKKSMKSKSNRFLFSLALSDNLVGFVLCPLSAVPLLKFELLADCYVEISRVFLSTALCGISAMMVGLIAYDRYILLSNLHNYHLKMSDKKIYVLIFVSWFLPTILQCFYVIHGVLYLLFLCVLTVGPFIVLTLSYAMMVRKIKQKEKELRAHKEKYTNLDDKKSQRKERRNLKLSRKLTLLVVCYVMCLLPALFNFLAEIFIRVRKIEKPVGLQILTVFSLLCASVNSVINPLIYVSKYPEFKREFRKMFGLKNDSRKNEDFSSISLADMNKK